jgi:C4-dicarboxylate transporter DctM subunit
MAALLIPLALILLVLSFPIFLAILVSVILSFEIYQPNLPSVVLGQRMVAGVNTFALLAVPLFIFAADVISEGAIGSRLVKLSERLVGHITGGLAIATVLTCMFFGAISGIGAAAVVSVGPILFPALLRQGYGRGFALGLILTSSTLAMLIPPGVAMILYSVQTGTSIERVFLAGLSGGVILGLVLAFYCYLYAKRRGIGGTRRATLSEIGVALKDASWALGLPVVIVGGIYGGVFTPTEAAAVAVVYAIAIEVFIYRQITPRKLLDVSISSSGVIGMLLILIAVGSVMTWIMTTAQIPQQISALLTGSSPVVILLTINVIFLITGMFIDPNAAIIVLTPLIFPAAQLAGIDPVHLGIVIVLNLAVGMVTPPFGLNIFVATSTFKASYWDIVKSLLPFIVLALVVLLVVTYASGTVTWLPGVWS